ncbi:glycoside hydrolase family 3 N-terminal domain-containing protein [uncultured Treponema sp.]|uniref:glycoside hydrolase family 3 N-terminal domain-containing protein n=1 Tax=uncultured Treponema sp. TaxID=162155 RepID=UPI0025E8AFE1|nr:glycoside hydrolase family 3 N-terminal domain-containing protein [uncultured Treponema sp.]
MNQPSLSVFFRVKTLCLFCAACSFFSCTKKLTPEQIEAERLLKEKQRLERIEMAKNQAVKEYAASLSDEVRISQLFLVNIEGNQKYSSVEKTGSLYGKYDEGEPLVPGGVLLFSYNISKDPLETYDYIKSIRDFYIENNNPPPFVAVDQEGGDVNRLRGLTSVLWSQKKVAASFSLEGASELYSAQARQMKNLGFHMNLAPVVEVENESNRDFLDTRTFGNLDDVLSYGKNAVCGYEENGIATVLKHFPGNSSTDPHTGLPEIVITKAELERNYIEPFKNLLPCSSAVLMSHARITLTDDDSYAGAKTPACLSDFWVAQILREKLDFKGLILSDDIFMGALAKNGWPPELAVVQAIEAGVDVIMLSEKRFGSVAKILIENSEKNPALKEKISQAVENVIRYKIEAGILEMSEVADSAENLSSAELESPVFSVRVNPDYAEFDLKKFDSDYNAGMKAYGMGK